MENYFSFCNHLTGSSLRRLALFLAIACGAVVAQVSTSRVAGTVTDSSGASVPGAEVELKNESTAVAYHVKASDAGSYFFESVPTGPYTVTITASGFKTFTSSRNILTVGQPMTVNAILQVGEATQSVQVTATAELVQTGSSANNGNVLGEKQIKDLPIVGTRGRNPLDLVLLQPGVVQGANTGGGIHVNGARDRAWNYTLDGIDNNEVSSGGSNTAPTPSNPDSLQEYRVVTTNASAEYGRTSGGQVVLATKSGTNEFHGGAFWFYRTPSLNANEWENNLQHLAKAQFVQNIYGGDLGGPIWKNHTFFFVNIQALAANSSTVVNRTVYTATARQGTWRYTPGRRTLPAGVSGASVDGAGNVLSGVNVATYNVVANDPQHAGIDPKIAAQINGTPLPNNFTGGDGLNTAYYTFSAPTIESQLNNTVKLDHIFNERHSVFVRAGWGHQNSDCDSVNAGQEAYPGVGCVVNTFRNPRNLAFSWRATLTPSFTNELVVGQSNYTYNFVSPLAKPGDIYFSGTPVVDTLSEFQAIGNARTLNTNQIVDNASLIRGSHLFKLGTNLRFIYHDDNRGSIAGENANQGVDFSTTYNPVDPVSFNLPGNVQTANDLPSLQSNINFLLGRVGRTAQGYSSNGSQFTPGNYKFKAHYTQLEFYAQDTWKVNRKLTLEYGLRFQSYLPPSEDLGRIAIPNQALVYGASPTNAAVWQKGDLYRTQNAWGPSIGFAYDLFGDGKTAIRSNYRMAYDPLNTFVLSSAIFQSLPGITFAQEDTTYGIGGGRLNGLSALSAPTISPSALAQPPAFSTNNLTVVDPNLKLPTTHEWTFGIQREVAPNTIVSIDYIGHRAYHLFSGYDANQVNLQQNGFVDAFNTARAGGESALLNQLTASDTRRRSGESGAAFLRRQFTSDLSLGSVANVADALANQAGAAPFFRRYPQFARLNVVDSNGFSTYNGLQAQIIRRLANDLEVQFGYTYQKSLDTGSYDPAFTVVSRTTNQSASSTPFDIGNRRLNYARSDFDRRHTFNSYWVAGLPFGRGKWLGTNANGWVDRLIGGWQVTGDFYYYSGRPFTVYSGIYTYSNVVSAPANCTSCSFGMGSVFTDPGMGYAYYFNQADRSKFSVTSPGAVMGTGGRNQFQTAGWFNMNLSLSKRVPISERINLELRADTTNLTNTPQWDNPTASLQSATFGRLFTPIGGRSRKTQLAVKINF